MALVYAIRKQGDRMLNATSRAEYLAQKDLFLSLLEVADHDSVAGPLIANDVQTVLDVESRRFHSGKG